MSQAQQYLNAQQIAALRTALNFGTGFSFPASPGVGGGGFSIGTTSTLAPGSAATATFTGPPNNRLLNLGIPAGVAGTNGTNGHTVLSGVVPPAAGDGSNGDFWIDTAALTIWGPKAGGSWAGTGPVSLVGPPGPSTPPIYRYLQCPVGNTNITDSYDVYLGAIAGGGVDLYLPLVSATTPGRVYVIHSFAFFTTSVHPAGADALVNASASNPMTMPSNLWLMAVPNWDGAGNDGWIQISP